ncbi:MAG TPA: hypothetical protein DCL63_02665 [Firmicutes bacterium]|jgi:hypothetical protein|nr:hypothetical protein [Bacillota bacterium]
MDDMNDAHEHGIAACKCGRPIVELIEEGFETLVEGYIVCSRCGQRMELDDESGRALGEALGAALGNFQDGIKKIAYDFKPDPDKAGRSCASHGGCGSRRGRGSD